MAEIFREPTSEEKKDFKDLLEERPTVIDKFKSQLQSKEKEYNLKRKPFCARCARIDFQDSVNAKVSEMERHANFETELSKFKITIPDLEQYGKDDRFKLIKDIPAMEPVNKVESGQVARQTQIGVHRDFKCKVRGCGISVFIPNSELK